MANELNGKLLYDDEVADWVSEFILEACDVYDESMREEVAYNQGVSVGQQDGYVSGQGSVWYLLGHSMAQKGMSLTEAQVALRKATGIYVTDDEEMAMSFMHGWVWGEHELKNEVREEEAEALTGGFSEMLDEMRDHIGEDPVPVWGEK